MKTQTYTKINTLHTRYMNLKKVDLPDRKWIAFQNKIIIYEYSDDFMEYVKGLKFDCFSKIDGTNAKIVYMPSTGECFCGGKTDSADIGCNGLKNKLDGIIERIKPILAEMFPKESARFVPVMDENKRVVYYEQALPEFKTEPTRNGMYAVELEESPVYIYGEFFGKGVQSGGNYDKDGTRFSVFDICVQGWWIPVDMLREYCDKLGLDMVPYIGQMTVDEAESMVRRGFETLVPNASNPDYMEEGIVARPVVPIKDPRGNRIIVKIKTKDYRDLERAIESVGVDEYCKFDEWYREHKKEIESL